jgi:hypothetical protein
MRQRLCSSALALASFGAIGIGIDIAAAQHAVGIGREPLELSAAQIQAIRHGLARHPVEPAQSGQHVGIGSHMPSTLAPQRFPNQVTLAVPQTRNYRFVKLPDRVLLVDPASETVAEIVSIPTGGAGSGREQTR